MAPDIKTVNTNAITEQTNKDSGRAFVTFLAGNGDYVKGVVGLAKGLRKTKTLYPLVVAILPDVPEEHRKILHSQGCIVKEIEPVYPPENQTQFAMAYYVINYSKLRIWEFVEYSKMIYLDGDIQVFENIDHLFDLPDNYFYAVMDCFCEKSWSKTPQYQIGYCQQCPDKVQWPSEFGPKPPLYFNAGMFVYEPDLATYRDLLKTVQVTKPTSFAEQDFLNMYFKDKYKPISNVYNLVLAMLWRHPENVELDKVKVVHYCAAKKPRRFKVGTKKVNQRKFPKFVSCSCHQKGYKQPRDHDDNPSSDDQEQNPSNPCHAIFIFLVPLLLTVLQVEYHNKKESPFDTHPIQKQTFLVAICIYSALLGIKIRNTLARCGFLDLIPSFVLPVSGSVSAGALFSILSHGVLLWLALIILGSIPIILDRHLLKNSVHWILGLVAKLDPKSKFSTMISIFHRKAAAQISNIKHTDRVEGV